MFSGALVSEIEGCLFVCFVSMMGGGAHALKLLMFRRKN